MESRIGVKFWGTRGMISAPSRDHLKYGGNSPAIEILHPGRLILVDTGFGVSNFGEILMERIIRQQQTLTIDIFFTHFHWDHIQGLPFFHPIYFNSTTINIYSPESTEVMHKNLNQLFDGSYSPFAGIQSMPSRINLISLTDQLRDKDMTVQFCPTNHGSLDEGGDIPHSYAYRFDFHRSGTSICIVTDHEAEPGPANEAVVQMCQGTDLLIHDAQYFAHDYPAHRGWGHSLVQEALNNASLSKAKRCLLTHHDPSRSDNEIDSSYTLLKGQPQNQNLDFVFAQEGLFYPCDDKTA